MKTQSNRNQDAQSRRGAVLLLVAISLPVLLLMVAFAVDVAWMQLARTELRTATDAASRAGSRVLGLTQDADQARAAAIDAASRNTVAGEAMIVEASAVEIGVSTQANRNARFQFSPGGTRLNAVKVDGRRTASSAAGPVGLLMGNLLPVSTFEPTQTAISTQLDRDVCLVVDRSGSMLTILGGGNPGNFCDPPLPGSRWAALARAVDAFLQELEATFPEEALGMVSYSSDVRGCQGRLNMPRSLIHTRLSPDYVPTKAAMTQLSSNPIGGRTAITAGIDDGIRVLTGPERRPFAVPTMVLMTDGIHNLGPEPREGAARAAAADIIIYTVTFSEDADLARMREVADITGGRHFHADTAGDLEAIFREIAQTLPVIVTK
ncbi:MAG: VWA domain-containing protein [Planctomycetota bacterium]|nr:VWA domain-containing protein [Planctomycetota bacterium]